MRISRICGGVIGLSLIAVGPAFGSLSASAVITSVPNGSSFNYTVKLTNTGTSDIGTFWFAWTPPAAPAEYDFLPTVPTSITEPTGWTGPTVNGFPGTSIEFYNLSGSAISAGQTGTFGFTSTDSPTTLAGLDKGFNFFPITESFIYSGFPESGSSSEVNPTVVVPEPSSAILAVIGCGLVPRWRRRN